MSHASNRYDFRDKAGDYAQLAGELNALLSGEHDPVANAANTAALIFDALPGLNWAGFYFLKGSELLVGPFQGKPACVRIPVGKGVCGTAAASRRPIIVPADPIVHVPRWFARGNTGLSVPKITNG